MVHRQRRVCGEGNQYLLGFISHLLELIPFDKFK